jgi:hypothetical protein
MTSSSFSFAFIPQITEQSSSSKLKAEHYCTYVQRSQNFKTHSHFLLNPVEKNKMKSEIFP